jgi:hypothetical protein
MTAEPTGSVLADDESSVSPRYSPWSGPGWVLPLQFTSEIPFNLLGSPGVQVLSSSRIIIQVQVIDSTTPAEQLKECLLLFGRHMLTCKIGTFSVSRIVMVHHPGSPGDLAGVPCSRSGKGVRQRRFDRGTLSRIKESR